MKSVLAVSFVLSALSGALASTCSVKHDTAMSLDFYKNVKASQSDCCNLCGSDSRCRTAVYSPGGECHLHDARDSAKPFADRGWMLMAVTPSPPTPPPTSKNIVQLAQSNPDLSTLVAALAAGRLTGTLSGTGPFTVFAPTDTAFTAALTALKITKQQLLDRADLADILKYHVLSGKVMSSALKASQTVTTVNTLPVTITKAGSVVKFATATVTGADVATSNGVIHVIDKVVLPPAGSATSATTSATTGTAVTSATTALVTGTPLMMLMMLCLVLFLP